MRKRTFLPINQLEMNARGWDELDFLLISGDAYVDHPSFGIAIIGRILEKNGFRVGIIAQPNWKDLKEFRTMGKPRLGCLITGGNLDSMVNHYTAAKKKRYKDAYSPGGNSGLRPDRATVVYSNRVREALPGVPVIIGGIEASLRRFAHYDYWGNDVRRSILLDSQADLLVFGMGEKAIVEVAERLNNGESMNEISNVRGTMVPVTGEFKAKDTITLPSYDEVVVDKKKYASAFLIQNNQQDPIRGKSMVQSHGQKGVVQNPPALPLTQAEMDAVYALPFVGTYHSSYKELGGIPAIEEVEFSLTSVRGCYGSCSFCALTFHQGRIIQSRSTESILREAEQMTWNSNFKGYIHDVGGPTANFRRPSCQKQLDRGTCSHKQCLFPEPCDQLDTDHNEYLNLLHRLRNLPRIKKVFVRSGIRYDALLKDKDSGFIRELCQHHVSGQLKVAPEHVNEEVLRLMGKPGKAVYEEFVDKFNTANKEIGKEQYLVPYLMSSHPGSTLKEAIELAEYVRDMGVNPEQVQDFIPTPGTLSTCMYYTGLDPRTMEPVYVPRSLHEKAMQRALIQYRNPKNRILVEEALRQSHREDLIGYGPKCLIRPGKFIRNDSNESGTSTKKKQIRRSGMKSKGVASKVGRSKDLKEKETLVKGTSSKEVRLKNLKGKKVSFKGRPSKEGRFFDSNDKDAPIKDVRSRDERSKDTKSRKASLNGTPSKDGRAKDFKVNEVPEKGVSNRERRSTDLPNNVKLRKGSLGQGSKIQGSQTNEKEKFKSGPDREIRKAQKKHGVKSKSK